MAKRNEDDSGEVTPTWQPVALPRDWGSSPSREPTDPQQYLTRGPTERAQAIVAATARESGDPTPIWMTAALADRGERIERHLLDMTQAIHGLSETYQPEQVASIRRTAHESKESIRKFQKFVWAAVLAAAGSIGTLVVFGMTTFEGKGRDSEKLIRVIDDMRREIDDRRRDNERLERAIDDLRARIDRRSSVEPGASLLVPPDVSLASKGTVP